MDYLNPWAMNPKGVFSVRDRRFGIRSFTKDDFNDPAHPFNQLVVGAVKAGIDVVSPRGIAANSVRICGVAPSIKDLATASSAPTLSVRY
jgi:hypothetical protein